MNIQSNRQLICNINDPVIERIIGDTVVSDFSDTTKYVVVTHEARHPSRDINDIDIASSVGKSFTRGVYGSGADLEIVRVSDVQTVIKSNRADLGVLAVQPKTQRVRTYYNNNGDVVLKWIFLFPEEVSYDVVQTTATGTRVVASGITAATIASLGGTYVGTAGSAGGAFVLPIQGGLADASNGIGGVASGGGYSLVIHKSDSSTESVNSSGMTYWQAGSPLITAGGTYTPPDNPPSIDTPGGVPQDLIRAGVVVSKTVTAGGVTTPSDVSDYIYLPAGALPKYSTYDLGKAYNIRYYSIKCDDATLAIKSWVFQGFNGTTWVDLDTQTNVGDWPANKLFFITNNAPYSKYRIKVDEVYSAGPDYLAVINEIHLFGNIEGEGIGGMVIGDTFVVS